MLDKHGVEKPDWQCKNTNSCRKARREGKASCENCARRGSRKAKAAYEANKEAINHASKCARHGITVAHYADLLETQGGVCAICGQTCKHYKNLAIDHDHECCPGVHSCGQCIRGLLCNNCNRALGMFNDDSDRLDRAASYLRGFEG